MKLPSKSPCRVLFSNLSQIGSNSPLFEREPLFIPALIELFKKKGVTSLFIEIGQIGKQGTGHIYDTILLTGESPDVNPEQVEFWVSHSGPCNADRSPKLLERISANNKGYLMLHHDLDEPPDSTSIVKYYEEMGGP